MIKTLILSIAMMLASHTSAWKAADQLYFSEQHLLTITQASQPQLISIPDLIFPIEGTYRISSSFGLRGVIIPDMGGDDGDFHRGVDIVAPGGTSIQAAAAGIVIMHYPPPNRIYKGHPVFGGLIVIEHASGVHTAYGHLSKSFIREGAYVAKGQTIGIIGNTGRSTGAHLHFEVLLNPMKLF